MGNINAPEVEYFESFAAEIQSKFQRVRQLVSHNVSSGDYHEEIIRTVLRNFLTKRFSVKKGFIYGGKDRVSRQVDIMIIDENAPAAYLFQEGDFAIVIPDAVVGIIEVKTTLGLSQFRSAVENIVSVKKLMDFPGPFPAIIFGYQGTEPSTKNLDEWFQGLKLPDDNYELGPNGVMFFEHGCLLTQYTDDGRPQLGGKNYYKVFRDYDAKDTGWQLSLVLAILVLSCERVEMMRTHTFGKGAASRLVQGEGAMVSHEKFVFGEGLKKVG
jgi:hypothetical protein